MKTYRTLLKENRAFAESTFEKINKNVHPVLTGAAILTKIK